MEKMLSWLMPVVMSLCLTGLLGCFKAPPTEPQTETEGKAEKRPPSGGGSASGMVEVPAGKFQRGSNGGEDDEKPAREVYLDTFWIDVYEVTVDEYGKCVREGGCSAPSTTSKYCSGDFSKLNNWGKSGRGKHPVTCVDWNQAVGYCKWAGKRLPTEAEWEKAARGRDGRKYPWGNEEPGGGRNGNFLDESFAESFAESFGKIEEVIEGYNDGYPLTAPVGSFVRGVSPYGVHDMAGNVFEWTADWHGADYYASAPGRNPMGPKSGSFRVIRGGSWNHLASNLRAAHRHTYSPSDADYSLGFRCARSN